MAAHAVSTETSDRMHGAAGAVDGAMQALQQGVSEGLPAVGGFFGRMVYTASYAISYGVVFPVMLVASAFPADNVLYQGLADGAMAARDRVSAWRDGEHDAGEDEEQEEGSGDGHDGPASTKTRRSRRTRHHRGGRRTSH